MINSEKVDEIQYSTGKVEEVAKIIESDCVCEKKEENENESNYTTSPQSCRVCGTTEVTTLVHGACLSCIGVLVRESVMKEKQSQSPCEPLTDRAELSQCEHKFNEGEVRTLYNQGTNDELLSLTTLYMCTQCGLVTCVNPNYK
jgi:hypothetical protein